VTETVYDRIGQTYTSTRRPDPRIAAALWTPSTSVTGWWSPADSCRCLSATNLRYWLADDGEPLSFGSIELWLAPVFTIMAAAALAGSVILLLNSSAERNAHRQEHR
jgi:hypothetical protein